MPRLVAGCQSFAHERFALQIDGQSSGDDLSFDWRSDTAERPAVRRVGTWIAEENSYMLAINVALGFRPAGGSGEWQLKLS